MLKKGRSRSEDFVYEPILDFQMKGIGYTNPEWGHGRWQGEYKERIREQIRAYHRKYQRRRRALMRAGKWKATTRAGRGRQR